MPLRTRAGELRRRTRAAVDAIRGGRANGAAAPAPSPEAQRDVSDFHSMRRLLAFSLGPEDNCVDVGAHRGAVLAEMVRVAPGGHHVAFEPIPALADLLRSEFPGVEVHQAAVSSTAGTSEFAHVRGHAEGWSGLRFRPLPYGEQAEVEQIVVPLEVLDEQLDPERRVAVVKVDVEGAEEQVLRGALDTLRRHRPVVIFEHGAGSANVYDTTPAGLFALLSDEIGYRVFDLDGNGPYTVGEFEHAFRSGERVNFVTHS